MRGEGNRTMRLLPELTWFIRPSGGPVRPEEREWPSFRGAINEAMREEMRRDPSVFQMGEDIAGAPPFGVTTGQIGRASCRERV